jgi:plasmid stability protein
MAPLIIRNIKDAIKAQLQQRARRNGCSLEDEVSEILRAAAEEETLPISGLGSEIAGLFAKVGLKSDIPEPRS